MKNSLWLALQYVIVVVASVVTLKLNLWNFGALQFGYWLTLAAFWGVAFLVDAGFSTSSVVFIAAARKKNDIATVGSICSTATFFFLLSAVVFYALSWAIMRLVVRTDLFSAFPSSISLVATSSLLGAAGAFSFVQGGMRSFFEGMEDFQSACKIAIAGAVVWTASVAVVAALRLSLLALAATYAAVSMGSLIATFIIFKVKFKNIRFSPHNISLHTARSMIGFGLQAQLATAFGMLIDPVIKFSFGKYLGMEHVSNYEIARRFATAFSGLYTTAFRNILPKSSGHATGRDFRNFLQSDMLKKVVRFGNVYSGFCFGVCSLVTWGMMHFWFRSDDSLRYFFMLAMAEMINILFYPYYISMLGERKTGILALLQAINLVLIGSSILVGCRFFGSGLALISYAFSVAVADSLIYFYFLKEHSFGIFKAMGFKCFCRFMAMLLLMTGAVAALTVVSGFVAAAALSSAAAVLFADDYIQIIKTRKSFGMN